MCTHPCVLTIFAVNKRTRYVTTIPWSWCSCRSNIVVPGWVCRSSCSVCSCARPSVEPPRLDQSAWTRPTYPPTRYSWRCRCRTEVPAGTATAGSDRCLHIHRPTSSPPVTVNNTILILSSLVKSSPADLTVSFENKKLAMNLVNNSLLCGDIVSFLFLFVCIDFVCIC